MTDMPATAPGTLVAKRSASASDAFVAKRYAAERRFRAYGLAALIVTTAFLAFLLFDIVSRSIPAWTQHHAVLTITVDPAKVDPANIAAGDFEGLAKAAWRAQFPGVTSRADRRPMNALLSNGAGDELRRRVMADPGLIGKQVTVPVLFSDDADIFLKGLSTPVERAVGKGPLTIRQDGEQYFLDAPDLKPGQIVIANNGALKVGVDGPASAADVLAAPNGPATLQDGQWKTVSFTKPEAELSGILGSLVGSLMVVFITVAVSLPVGVAAAMFLEEFAPKNRFTDIIEVNINNLAAVPSIIFGLLGLAIFLGFFGMPRSIPLVGGLVIALMSLPTVIIASRAAIRAVPPSIRDAAIGIGASHQQAVFHHVLPLAMPGIMTGTILAVASAIGETAPLLLIGMVAFIVDVPTGFTDSATVLPVQIFLWSDLPELAFVARTAAAIVVLLVVMLCLNALAIYLRKRFERRW